MKKAVFDLMFDHFNAVWVTIDTAYHGVDIPPSLLDKLVVLRLEPFNPENHRDFSADDDGWSATLSFDGASYFCTIPWIAVRQLVCRKFGATFADEETEVPKPTLKLVN